MAYQVGVRVRRSNGVSFQGNEDWTPDFLSDFREIAFAGVTGSGKADLILVTANTVLVRRSTGFSFGPEEDWTQGPLPLGRGTYFADVDGDGRADLILVTSQTVKVRRSTGSSFGPEEDWTHGACYGSRGTFFADVDGDRKADCILVNDNTTTVRRSTGRDFGPGPQANEDWSSGPYFGNLGTYFADVDGDGKADAIVRNELAFGLRVLIVRRSTGANFKLPNEEWAAGPDVGSRGTFFADVDGDGRADAIAVNDNPDPATYGPGVLIRRSTGNSFGPIEDWGGFAPYLELVGTYFADVDGDGQADAIAVGRLEPPPGPTYGSPG
jgi:FG-GAP-like repeat